MDKQVKAIQEQSDNSEELIGNDNSIEQLIKINYEIILKNLKLEDELERQKFDNELLHRQILSFKHTISCLKRQSSGRPAYKRSTIITPPDQFI